MLDSYVVRNAGFGDVMLQNFIRSARRFGAVSAVLLAVVAGVGPATAQVPGTYTIDPAASEIHWRIYKAGAFARFGHNHVIAIAEPTGTVEVAANLAESTFTLQFQVAELSVDDAQLRQRYGEDFASVPSADDIAGTATNMLTEQVLNGAMFPSISVVGTQLSGLGPDQTIELSIAMLGRTVALSVPVDVSFDGATVRARAAFRLQHEDLGMEPFSVMMGALQVAPEIDFTIDVRAAMQGGDAPAL